MEHLTDPEPTTSLHLAGAACHAPGSRPRTSRRLRRRVSSVAFGVCALGVIASPARANGRFPEANQIVFSPTDPDLVVLRTTYGILPSHDNGATWQYLCEETLGVGTSALADPPLGLTQNDSLLAGVSLGLDVSPDVGCNWNCIGGPLAGQVITDLAVRPDAPSRAVAITGSYVVQADSGQELQYSQIFETKDNGVGWAALGTPLDPHVAVTTVDVTKTDPNRLYVSGSRGYGAGRTASLFVSKDAGQTWTERPLPPDQFDPATEDTIFIAGVDPANADRLYLRSSGPATGGQSRLTVVTLAADGTPTFATAHLFDVTSRTLGLTGEMLGFALSPDGSKVYIGSKEDGLWAAQASDLAFTKTSSIAVQCLATRGNELWACSNAVSGFVAGVSTDGGKTFAVKLPLVGALAGSIACSPNASAVACGQQANASQCGPYYQQLCNTYTCGPASPTGTVDASAADASSRGDALNSGTTTHPHPSSSSSSSSCASAGAGAGGAAGLGAAWALVGLALQRRRRR